MTDLRWRAQAALRDGDRLNAVTIPVGTEFKTASGEVFVTRSLGVLGKSRRSSMAALLLWLGGFCCGVTLALWVL